MTPKYDFDADLMLVYLRLINRHQAKTPPKESDASLCPKRQPA